MEVMEEAILEGDTWPWGWTRGCRHCSCCSGQGSFKLAVAQPWSSAATSFGSGLAPSVVVVAGCATGGIGGVVATA